MVTSDKSYIREVQEHILENVHLELILDVAIKCQLSFYGLYDMSEIISYFYNIGCRPVIFLLKKSVTQFYDVQLCHKSNLAYVTSIRNLSSIFNLCVNMFTGLYFD